MFEVRFKRTQNFASDGFLRGTLRNTGTVRDNCFVSDFF